jgi:hypothetical protein
MDAQKSIFKRVHHKFPQTKTSNHRSSLFIKNNFYTLRSVFTAADELRIPLSTKSVSKKNKS